VAALSASGLSSARFAFEGFLPAKPAARRGALTALLDEPRTLILYEAPHRLTALLEDVAELFGDREAALAKELTKRYQRFYRGTASELLEGMKEEIRGEWVVVIEASEGRGSSLSEADILALDIPKKAASKLISRITGENPKECYQRLLNS
jgi:16S rRNA (cytidine1402-2'-O)-methyltransferase